MTKKNTAVKSSSPEEFLSVRDRLLACETVKWAEGFSFVAGVDEAGRGCMAGPVVAAAVVFTERNRIPAGVFDSKQLSHAERMRMRERILADPSILYAVGEVSPEEIDRINILRATWKAMGMALEQLKEVQFALIDGNPVKGLPVPSQSIVKGDAKSASIAAASILATVISIWRRLRQSTRNIISRFTRDIARNSIPKPSGSTVPARFTA